MFAITKCVDWELSRPQLWSLMSLLQQVWPMEGMNVSQRVEHFVAVTNPHRLPYRTGATELVRFIAWDKEIAIGQVETFARQVRTAAGNLRLMAFSGLAVLPEWRRRGHGLSIESSLAAQLCRMAFSRVDKGEFPVTLFQTCVPKLASKLGAKPVETTFVDKTNKHDPLDSPWSEKHIMIYPSTYEWPEGEIDLNGPGY